MDDRICKGCSRMVPADKMTKDKDAGERCDLCILQLRITQLKNAKKYLYRYAKLMGWDENLKGREYELDRLRDAMKKQFDLALSNSLKVP